MSAAPADPYVAADPCGGPCVERRHDDTVLARDPDFATVCDARRDAWIAAMEALDAETAAQWVGVVRAGGDALDRAAGGAL